MKLAKFKIQIELETSIDRSLNKKFVCCLVKRKMLINHDFNNC